MATQIQSIQVTDELKRKLKQLDGYGFVIPYNDFKAVIERLENL